MPRWFCSILVLGCLAILPTEAATLSHEIDKLFTNYNQGKLPGVAVAVVRNGKMVHQRGYGFAELGTKRLITANTVFEVTSVTKPFTALAIMLLADRGKLGYDDPLVKHLPEFAGVGEGITLRHLLHHTAGLPDYEQLFREGGLIDPDYPRQAQLRAGFEPTAKDVVALLCKQKQLRFPPGTRWEYSHSAYVVLGQVIERVSGQTYARFLREHIFRPLGMKNTLVSDATRPAIPNRATSFRREDAWLLPIDYTPLNLVCGDRGINSTLNDLLKWTRAIARHGLATEASWQAAMAPALLNDGQPVPAGFGWVLGDRDGAAAMAESGAWAGFRGHLEHCPDRGYSVIILSNHAGVVPMELADKIAKLCFSAP
jgi:CubicO group peptidase (beta-lactamase class C family)